MGVGWGRGGGRGGGRGSVMAGFVVPLRFMILVVLVAGSRVFGMCMWLSRLVYVHD